MRRGASARFLVGEPCDGFTVMVANAGELLARGDGENAVRVHLEGDGDARQAGGERRDAGRVNLASDRLSAPTRARLQDVDVIRSGRRRRW